MRSIGSIEFVAWLSLILLFRVKEEKRKVKKGKEIKKKEERKKGKKKKRDSNPF